MKARFIFPSLALLLIACGGSQVTIEHRIAMDKLWHAPPEKRNDVAERKRQLNKVTAELEHTRFLLHDAESETEIAQKERERARLDAEIADLEQERRKKHHLAKLADEASSRLDVAHKQEGAARRRLDWLESQVEFLEAQLSYLAAENVAAEARFELAKAQLAKKVGALPKGSQLSKYKSQAKSAEAQSAGRRREAERRKSNAAQKRKKWQASLNSDSGRSASIDLGSSKNLSAL